MTIDRRIRAAVLACFFVSGATGLVYEGIWFRYLQGLFGVTTHALAVVVAAFMGGLAAGSWALGRAADRTSRPLRLYGALEIGVALVAPLVPLLIRGVEHLYVAAHPGMSQSLLWLSLLRLLLALGTLLVPTLLMGGTLPVLTVFLRREAAARGGETALHRSLGRLYGLNTLGALVGTALVGFVLLSWLGLWRTTLLAAAANLGIGLWAVWRGARVVQPPDAEEVRGAPEDPSAATAGAAGAAPAAVPSSPHLDAGERPLLLYVWVAFAVSGALSLAYEVAWTRVLTQIIGSSTYAFSMILAAFLLGIGLGSLLLSGWRGRDQAGLWGFCWAELGIGASAALVVPLFVHLPELQLRAFRGLQQLNAVLGLQFGLCLLVVLVPTLCMGMTFPLLAGYVTSRRRGHVGGTVGRLYAANTVGGIAGSMLAGFVALPVLGTQRTLQVAVLGNVAVALAGLVLLARNGAASRAARGSSPTRRPQMSRLALAVISLLVLLGTLLTPRWDPYLLDAGLAVVGPAAARGSLTLSIADLAHSSDILFYREGLNANISVRKDETQLYLKTNGKTDGTSFGDMPTQLMLGLLPTLVHPRPRRTLVIGLGTGASASAAAAFPGLERLDVVEIEPAVVEAARRYFGVVNQGLFADRRATVWVDDARAYLLTTPQRYDIVVSEPSNPWIAGVANLFSVEHYERCAARLQPDGILSQWLQIYAMSPDLVRMVLASIREVFPHVAIYSFRHGDLVVLASRVPLPRLDFAAVTARLAECGMEVTLPDVLGVRSAAGLAGFFVLGGDDVARYVASARLNTEDRPRLEFEAPRSLYLATSDLNSQLLRAERSTILPPLAAPPDAAAWLDVARANLRTRRSEDAQHGVDMAMKAGAPRAEALTLAGEIAMARGQAPLAGSRLEEALQIDPASRRAAVQLATLRFMQRRGADAVALLERACPADSELGAEDLEPYLQLLELASQTGNGQAAHSWGERLLGRLPAAGTGDPIASPAASQRARLLGLLAWADLDASLPAVARRRAEEALALNPQCTAAWRVQGRLEFEAGRYGEAARWWRRLVDYRQIGVDILVPLAEACLRAGDRDQARRYLNWALAEQPQYPPARRLQAELR